MPKSSKIESSVISLLIRKNSNHSHFNLQYNLNPNLNLIKFNKSNKNLSKFNKNNKIKPKVLKADKMKKMANMMMNMTKKKNLKMKRKNKNRVKQLKLERELGNTWMKQVRLSLWSAILCIGISGRRLMRKLSMLLGKEKAESK